MVKYNVKYSDLFLEDLSAIVLHILNKSGSVETVRRFYENVLAQVERRSFGADSYEIFHPYEGAPDYYRIYFGHYTVFYVISDNVMDVRRILWSGRDMARHL